jgi:hypothetical protein
MQLICIHRINMQCAVDMHAHHMQRIKMQYAVDVICSTSTADDNLLMCIS